MRMQFCLIIIFFLTVTFGFAHGFEWGKTINVQGWHDTDLGYNPNTNMIYVPGNPDLIINGTSNEVVGNLTTSLNPSMIAVNEKTNVVYYYPNTDSGYLKAVNGSTNKIIDDIPLGGSDTIYLAINSVTNLLYVNRGVDISVINGSTNTVIGKLPMISSSYHIIINENTNRIYLLSYDSGTRSTIYEIDGSTNKTVDKISIYTNACCADILGINQQANLLYIAYPENGAIIECKPYIVQIIDLSSKEIAGNATIITPRTVSVNPHTGKAYVGSDSCHNVTVIDARSGKVLDNIESYTESVVNSNTDTIYAFDPFEDKLTAIYDPEKVPEFPFAVPVLLASITLLIVFYRMKFKLF